MLFKAITIALLVVYVQAQTKTGIGKRLTSTPGLGNYRTAPRASSSNQKRQADGYLLPTATIVENYQAPSLSLGGEEGASHSLEASNYGAISLADYSSNVGILPVQEASHSSGSSYVSYTQGGSSGDSYNQESSGSYVSLGQASSSAQAGESYDKEPKAYPKYAFKYGVEDKHTGDIKAQEETRDGDNVKGYYTLQEPDGTVLVVRYTVEGKSGFNAVVERQGHANHPQHSSKN